MFRPLLPLFSIALFCSCALGHVTTLATARASTWSVPSPSAAIPDAAVPDRTQSDEVDAIVADFARDRDDADPELLTELADIGSRAAADGLLEIYDRVGSIYMKREVLLVLPDFDTIPEAGQVALQRLMDVATSDGPRELRVTAIDSLGRCFRLGKSYLAMIVESHAMDDMRVRAMERHLELAEQEDFEWYRKVYETPLEPELTKEEEKAKRKKSRRSDDDPPPPRRLYNLQPLRELALGHIVSGLSEDEVVIALKDGSALIRREAMSELESRGYDELDKVAEDVLEYVDAPPRNRALAAGILARMRGVKVTEDFIDLGRKLITPDLLRSELARLLAEMRDEEVDKRVARLLGKGKPYEKVFALRAALYNTQKNVDKKIRSGLEEKNRQVVLDAIQAVAVRKDLEAMPLLEEILQTSQDEESVLAAIAAVDGMLGPDPDWEQKLEGWLESENALIRNASLQQIAVRREREALPLLFDYLEHADWSTRRTALRALIDSRESEIVGPIIERMASEDGRMLHEFADALFLLTGQPFRTRQSAWQAWWEDNADSFEIISEEELEERRGEEEARRLRQVTGVRFFGVQIVSTRVIFIVDVSGSMAFDTRPEFEIERPEPRLDVAKRELIKCIDGLEEGALFNILIFSGDVSAWLDDGVAGASGEAREEAKQWVNRLGANGATNLYDALELALEDPDVDTIYLLSDGEPSAGAVVDPFLIRDEIKRLNEHRGIVIHSIAVGESLQVLRWLAEDSGGSYVQFQ